ncbi:MAG: DEAD/DEAH box helicase, partial [Spirochaetota bacterium]
MGPDLDAFLETLKRDPRFAGHVAYWGMREAREASYAPLPPDLHPRLAARLEELGVGRLYTHQAEAYRAVKQGRHVVLTTPTASGKSLAYNLPVLEGLLADPDARA